MSVKASELKKRYDSGEKFGAILQKRVDRELQRVCNYKPCNESLAFGRKDSKFCSKGHKSRETTRLRKYNKVKKDAYNKRHGIIYKPQHIHKNPVMGIEQSTRAIAATETLFYENYKEPLKRVEKGKGFGYYGTIAVSQDRNLVQCHLCGYMFSGLNTHIRKHKITPKTYKEMFGLSSSTALIGEATREKMQQNSVHKFKDGLPKHLEGFNERRQRGELKVKGHGMSLEVRNKLGICPDQVLQKIQDLADKLGKTPGRDDFEAEYKGKYIAPIKTLHGSWANAVEKLGMITREQLRHPDKERLIMDLQDFQKLHNRIPMTSDFNRGLLRDKGVYIRVFGTLNNARIEAGMNAVLPLPFGQKIEMTPEQYMEYKQGHIPRVSKRKAGAI